MSDEGCTFYQVVYPNKCQANIDSTQKMQDHLNHHCELRKVAFQLCYQIITVKSYPGHQPNICGEQGLVW